MPGFRSLAGSRGVCACPITTAPTAARQTKEFGLARHQTGHNSGVIHSGIYYEPGSLKADLCRRGAQATKDFCSEHGIPVTTQGKLLVATDDRDAARMADLVQRAAANQIEAVPVSASELREMEPHVEGVAALLVPATGSVDYTLVSQAMATAIRTSHGAIHLGIEATGVRESAAGVFVTGRDRTGRSAAGRSALDGAATGGLRRASG